MKKILLFVAAAVAAVSVQAQSVQMMYKGEVLQDGAVVEVTEYDAEAGEMPWHVEFKNNTGTDVEVIMSYESYDNKYSELMGIPGFGDGLSLCTWQCVAGESVTAPAFYVDAEGNPDCAFHTAFMIMSNQPDFGGYQDAYIKADYMLVNAANEDDFTYVTVIFDYAKYVAAVNKAGVNNNMNVYQRGANLVCNYAFDAVAERSLVVTNIVGARVANVALDGNNGEVSLDRLSKGVYVYTLVENGRNVKSQKIVVR